MPRQTRQSASNFSMLIVNADVLAHQHVQSNNRVDPHSQPLLQVGQVHYHHRQPGGANPSNLQVIDTYVFGLTLFVQKRQGSPLTPDAHLSRGSLAEDTGHSPSIQQEVHIVHGTNFPSDHYAESLHQLER